MENTILELLVYLDSENILIVNFTDDTSFQVKTDSNEKYIVETVQGNEQERTYAEIKDMLRKPISSYSFLRYGQPFDFNKAQLYARFKSVNNIPYRKLVYSRLATINDPKISKHVHNNISNTKEKIRLEEAILSSQKENDQKMVIRQKNAKNKFGKRLFYDPFLLLRKINLKVKQRKPELESVLLKTNCDFKEMETLWNDKMYGPIPAMFIYLGCTFDKINEKALKRTWLSLRRDIMKIMKISPHYAYIYEQLTGLHEYAYCKWEFNFLIDFYEKGLCNCECGSFLVFTIAKMVPYKDYKCFLVLTKNHIQPVFMKNFDDNFTFETTIIGGSVVNNSDALDDANFAIYSEQIVAIYILTISSARLLKPEYVKLINEILDLDIKNKSLEENFLMMNRTAVKTLLDSNTLDILVFIAYTYEHFEDSKKYIKECYTLNQSYIGYDLIDICRGVIPTRQQLSSRKTEFQGKLANLFK